jgi:hypothetical protein
MTYTPLETTILLTLRENFDELNGIDPKALYRALARGSDSDVTQELLRTLRLLVAEGLIYKVEHYDEQGEYSVLGFKATRDGLRVARTMSSTSTH